MKPRIVNIEYEKVEKGCNVGIFSQIKILDKCKGVSSSRLSNKSHRLFKNIFILYELYYLVPRIFE